MRFVRSVRSFGLLCSLVVLLSLLSACGEPEPRFAEDGQTAAAAPTEETSASPTESASVPEEEADEVPAYPSAAQGSGRAAAVAFVRHYFAMIDYASNTGKVAPLRRLGDRERCRACAGGIAYIEDVYADGGHIEGLVQTVSVKTAEGFHGPGGVTWLVSLDDTSSAHVEVHASGKQKKWQEGTDALEVMVARLGPASSPWRVTDFRLIA